MILIADAGSTKIKWVLLANTEKTVFTTAGFNPNISDRNYLRQILVTGFPSDIDKAAIQSIYYFGAGCGTVGGKGQVEKGLRNFFNTSCEITIKTDLEAAGRAAYNTSKGMVGILGTGANAGFYNGNHIEDSPVSLGYLLGDEGSGSYFGKKLIAKIIREEFPANINEAFYLKYKTMGSALVQEVYGAKQPNRQLALYTRFMKEQISNNCIQELILKGFSLYFEYNLKQLIEKYPERELTIVGGVAHAFQKQLQQVLTQHGIDKLRIIESPIDLLLEQFR